MRKHDQNHALKINIFLQTGIESDRYTEILHGLHKGDIVIITGAYLLNSEYIFKNGADPMAGMKM